MDANVSEGNFSDIDWTSDDESETNVEAVASANPTCTETIVGNEEASSSNAARSKMIGHFVGMGFAEKLVLKAIDENGEGDPDSILNLILTFSTLEESPPQQLSTNSDPCSSGNNENFLNDLSDMESWSEDELEDRLKGNDGYKSEKHKMLLSLAASGSLSERERKLLDLADMGYALEDAELALERWPEAPVDDLIEIIGAAQMAREEDCYLPEDDLKPKHILSGGSKSKKRKHFEMKKNVIEESIRLPNPMIGFGVPSMQPPERVHRSLPLEARGPPYFYYENVALTPKGVWDTISRFLYDIEPEFVDSKFFSACARKRGYIHNLPIENRFPLVPLPPLTIQQAFPLSRRWWPSWDPRDKMNCIQTAIASAKLTERIRTALERSGEGDPPEAIQRYVMEQCRKWNLVWVGRNKVAPLEPDEVEMLLGFPKNHTRGGGISRTDRYKSLGNSFQVDTVAYHLSVLKDMFPHGVNVLSLFSGIGGAEVALHRLGIKLKNVVSIEKSKANRDIVRSWWEQTNQTGSLIDFDDVTSFDAARVEQIIGTIGNFDLVVGGSPCNNLAGSNRVSRDGLEGKESSLFYDYFRILDLVKLYRQEEV
ncbi:DNA (cytosine-5)-methyltransferase DRM2 [Salvia hispanica]|uniref:DNA (cytosine-5)-methyltransferase DRM2 n=1 Tax=Salvia hispanica TaxID=49212 RepID=UPI0020099E3A|nr:DNA (cytosine-5)-methyltransferase DRM2 [Salvia hispanica]XP_047973519.1 DNA (cytosine-5)-methyltransferase DRM2 [Salvia hispanica]XP_047973520.1 DNA (cytosine-5)-methyltransferase DRM2 [Salvia hispanica]